MMKQETLTVTILSSSDVHGFYQPWDYSTDKYTNYGGLSRVSTVYKRIKKANPNTMIIDVGDLIQGNSAENFLDAPVFPGVAVLNKIGYEIYAMGNHEFNFGMENLKKVVSQFNGISMMGNLYKKTNGERQLNGIYIKHFGPIKIAFVALTTHLVRYFEEKRGNLENHDVVNADIELRKLLNEVGDVDALIGVFHMGSKNENAIPNTGVYDLLNNVEGASRIDAVFGGHMHGIIPELWINNTVFMQPGSRAEAINRLDISFDLESKKIINKEASVIYINDRIENDKEILNLLKPYHNRLRSYANEHIGYVEGAALTPIDTVFGIPETRVAQTKVTDFFLEVMQHYSGADVVAIQFDTLYPNMPAGEIKRKHIDSSYTYSGGDISTFEITGQDLLDYMEWSAAYFNQSKPGDVTISFDKNRFAFKYSTFDIFGNIKYTIDLSKEKGQRIRNLTRMDGRPIFPTDRLIIGLNKYRMDYLVSEEGPLAGREFKFLWSSIREKKYGVRGTIRNLAMHYIENLPDRTYRPTEDKRWEVRLDSIDEQTKRQAIDLINKDLLELPKDEADKVDLSQAINVNDSISLSDYENLVKYVSEYKHLYYPNMRILDVIRIIYGNN